MPTSLSQQQIDQYHERGYLTGIRVMSNEEAHSQRGRLEALERCYRDKKLPQPISTYLRVNAHYVCRQAAELVKHPAIVEVACGLLGPDLLAWSAEFFIKEPGTDKIVSWHQDLTYWGIGPTEGEVTAWLALSPSTRASGCMRFIPGSHYHRLLEHKDTFADRNLLSRGQEVVTSIDENEAVDIELQPGEISLHHGRLFHSSGPNTSADRRIGLAIRYLRPDVKQRVAKKDYAMLVRGWDRHNHFTPVAGPVDDFDEDALRRHETIVMSQKEALAQGASQALKRG